MVLDVTAQHATPLLTALQICAQRDYAPFHTPGHKQGRGAADRAIDGWGRAVFQADLPELPELDNLFAPQGVIAAAQGLAAAAFGAEQTWFLANGSTSGVIAAIAATCAPDETIILPRNVHQSAISGLVLTGARPVFVLPEYDAKLDLAHCPAPEAIAAALAKHPTAKAVLLVSPTYYGVCADITQIAQIVHQHGIPLLVDEAHGAHFAFHPELPPSALSQGADLVVQSTHKTLSALTQAAMLHVQGDRLQRDRLSRALQLVQSTSPNYLLLASLDAARQQMATQGKPWLDQAIYLANQGRSQLAQIPGLSVLQPQQASTPGFAALDPTRLTVTVADLGLDGFTADGILNRELGVTAELPTLHHLSFIVTGGTRPSDMERLVAGFRQLAQEYPPTGEAKPNLSHLAMLSELALSPRNAFFAVVDSVALEDAVGRVSSETLCPYPPGIPVVLPGEVITPEAIAYLRQTLTLGGCVNGCADPTLATLRVVQQ